MLIQLKISNYKTFKQEATLSFAASGYDKSVLEENNVYIEPDFNRRILKSAVIYGANASGKSKFFDAFGFMRSFIITNVKWSQSGKVIPVIPFLLSTTTVGKPSEFEIVFLHKGSQYRYGFEVDQTHVISEWLFRKQKKKEIELFYREDQSFEVHKTAFKKGKIVVDQDMVPENALLLAQAAQFNEQAAIEVMDWFRSSKMISGIRHESYQGFTMTQSEKELYRDKIKSLIREADFGISDFRLEKVDPENLPANIPDDIREAILEQTRQGDKELVLDTMTKHSVYDQYMNHVQDVEFSMNGEESNGTDKFFSLSGPLLDTLQRGTLLIVDELDTRLHPHLVCKIVSLFNSKETNPKGAQLLFNTHDTNLLGSKLFRRDQVWFTEKNKYGEAILYSLSDFKGAQVRNDEDYRGNYLKGKYGAIPFLGNFDFIQ